MLILAVHVTIKAGHEDAVLDPFRKLQAETRREPGCIYYVVQRSRENPRHYLVYEQYKDEAALEGQPQARRMHVMAIDDEAALEAHRNSSHFKQYATGGFYPFVEDRRAELFDPIV